MVSSCFPVSACLNVEFFFVCLPGYKIYILLHNQFSQWSSYLAVDLNKRVSRLPLVPSSWLTIPKHFILIYVLFSCCSSSSGFPGKHQRCSVSPVVAHLTMLSYLAIGCISIKVLVNSFLRTVVIPPCSVL